MYHHSLHYETTPEGTLSYFLKNRYRKKCDRFIKNTLGGYLRDNDNALTRDVDRFIQSNIKDVANMSNIRMTRKYFLLERIIDITEPYIKLSRHDMMYLRNNNPRLLYYSMVEIWHSFKIAGSISIAIYYL